jgi:glucokinase
MAERTDATILRNHDGKLTARMIQEAAQQGDAFALELYEYTALILGQTLADMVAVTSPEAIVFFGGLANAGDMLLVPVKKHLEDQLLNIYKNKVKILKSGLPDADAAILGASALAWKYYGCAAFESYIRGQ